MHQFEVLLQCRIGIYFGRTRPRGVGGSAWVGALETERLAGTTRPSNAQESDNPDPSSWKVPAPTLGVYSLGKGLRSQRSPAQELSLP